MFDICVVVLCGIPGSGKSTFAKSIIDRKTLPANSLDHDSSDIHWLLVSYDDLIPSNVEKDIIEKEKPNAWKECRENIQNAVDNTIGELQKTTVATDAHTTEQENSDSHFEILRVFLQNMRQRENGVIVILIDDNMYYNSMRYKYYQLTRKYGVGFCQVYIDCDTDLALVRNRQRQSRQVPDDVILNMATRFEVPNPDQNSWEKHSITVNTNSRPEALEFSLIDTMEVICRALSDPSKSVMEEVDPASREVDRKICSENIIHQADLIMRKLIAENMKQASSRTMDKMCMRTLAVCLKDIKSDILQKMKRGVVYFQSLEDLTSKLREMFHEKEVAAGYG